MKLRKKKTGMIVECENIVFAHCNALALDWEQYSPNVNSLAELNEEWEDYKPAEPLIKDEKIRKAVRAWADGNMATRVQYDAFWRGFRHNNSTITVLEDLPFEDGKIYSIAELCGEEE